MVRIHGTSLKTILITTSVLSNNFHFYLLQPSSLQYQIIFQLLVYQTGRSLTKQELKLLHLYSHLSLGSIQQDNFNFQMIGQELISLNSLQQSQLDQFYTNYMVRILHKNLVELSIILVTWLLHRRWLARIGEMRIFSSDTNWWMKILKPTLNGNPTYRRSNCWIMRMKV